MRGHGYRVCADRGIDRGRSDCRLYSSGDESQHHLQHDREPTLVPLRRDRVHSPPAPPFCSRVCYLLPTFQCGRLWLGPPIMPPGLANCFVERGDLIAPRTLAQCFTGPYRVPNVRMTSTALLTNKTRPAPVARPAATRAHSFASGYNAERRLVGPERVPFARSPFGPDGCTSSLQHLFDRKCPQNPIADGAGHGPSPSTTGGTTVTAQVLSLLSDACAPAWFASGAFNDGPTITGVPSAIASATTDSARAFGVSEARFR